MIIAVATTTNIEVKCSECGEVLKGTVQYVGAYTFIFVEPCNCTKEDYESN